jgi:hypothetical protein
MNSDTITSRYFFTVAQLEKMTDDDLGKLHQEGEDQRGADRFAKWHEALFFASDPIYRENRIREERGLPPLDNKSEKSPASPSQAESRYPMFSELHSQPTIVRSGLTREDISALVGPIKRHVREKISEAVGGLASAEIVSQQGFRIVELEGRLAQLEKRLATAESRFDSQARHLRNLQSRLDGGPIEHSPKVPR